MYEFHCVLVISNDGCSHSRWFICRFIFKFGLLFVYLFIYFPDSCFDWELLVLLLRRLLPLPLLLVLLPSALSLLSLFKQIIKRNDQPNDPSTLHTMSSESMREKVWRSRINSVLDRELSGIQSLGFIYDAEIGNCWIYCVWWNHENTGNICVSGEACGSQAAAGASTWLCFSMSLNYSAYLIQMLLKDLSVCACVCECVCFYLAIVIVFNFIRLICSSRLHAFFGALVICCVTFFSLCTTRFTNHIITHHHLSWPVALHYRYA